MNLVFMSNTLTPNRKENVDWILHKKESSKTQKFVDLLPYNTFPPEVFFEYTRLNNDWIRYKNGMMLRLLKNYQIQKNMLFFMIPLIVLVQLKN